MTPEEIPQSIQEAIFRARLEAMRRAPEMDAAREQGLLPKIALVMTEQRALREFVLEGFGLLMDKQSEQDDLLAKVQARQIELYEMFQKILARLDELGR